MRRLSIALVAASLAAGVLAAPVGGGSASSTPAAKDAAATLKVPMKAVRPCLRGT